MKPVTIYDTTLRDGTQGTGISFSILDKIRVAQRLDAFGVDYIEGGWPGSNPRDAAFFSEAAKLEWKNAKITAFGSTLAALAALGSTRIAYGTPYSEATTLQGKQHLEAHGITVVSHGTLPNVRNIYEESEARAYALARSVNHPDAQAVFLSGTGMPTIGVLQTLEDDLGKPVISAASVMMWHALQVAGIRHSQPGYGRLFA